MKKMSQRTKWILISIAGVAVLGWSVLNTLEATQPSEEVKTAKARTADIVLSVDGAGTLEMATLPIGFEVSGEIANVLPSGTFVKKGDVIATLVNDKEVLTQMEAALTMAALTSPASYAELNAQKLELEDERALALDQFDLAANGPEITYYAEQVSLTEARYWEAVAALRRVKKITPSMKMAVERALEEWETAKLNLEWAINFVPSETDNLLASAQLTQTDTALQDADIATAVIQGVLDPSLDTGASLGAGDLADSWHTLQAADLQFERSMIVAPFDGMLTNVNFAVGEKTSAYQIIAKLVDPNLVTVNFTVEEMDLFALNVGDPLVATLSAYPTVTLSGEVTEFGAKVGTNGSVEVIGRVSVPEGIIIFSGMTVDVVVETEKADNALVLNSAAIFADVEGKPYVMKIGTLGANEITYVLTGISDLANIQILSGLEAGDVVSLTEPQEQE